MKQIPLDFTQGDDAWYGWRNAIRCAAARAIQTGRRQQVKRGAWNVWIVQEIR